MRNLRPAVLVLNVGMVFALTGIAVAQKWVAPTPEELAMTSVPEAPGAAAVILTREQITDDLTHTIHVHIRIKVLTEGGLDFANVGLPYSESGLDVRGISGRTIHPDGLISPFDGKVREQVTEKQGGFKYKQKTFTMPAASVGCILEYRYELWGLLNYSPEWHLQDDLFEKSVRFSWRTPEEYTSTPGVQVAWNSVLPKDAAIQTIKLNGSVEFKLEMHNVPTLPREDYMPPEKNVGYRVNFYVTTYKSPADFWTKAGAEWAQERDLFIGPGPAVKDFVNKLVAAGDSEQLKLRKIYATVTKLENTEFTRERTEHEEKAHGLKPVANTDDVLTRGRGNAFDLTQLFVAMARAAGMKAYLMAVADRSERMFTVAYLSFSQLADDVAIVRVNGTEQFFDPGAGGCAYGELAWYDSESGGLRQAADGGAELARTPDTDYKASVTQRTGDLAVDEHGVAAGKVRISYTGAGAQRWRRASLLGDETSVEKGLKESLEKVLPDGFEVALGKIENLGEPGQPLVVNYEVKGTVGVATGKRLLLPASFFESAIKPRFTEAARTLPIDLHYASAVQDAVRLRFPAGFALEAFPAPATEKMIDVAVYDMKSRQDAQSITLSRDLVLVKAYLGASQYPALRQFFSAVEAKDQDKVVLLRSAAEGGAR